jgi:Kef-type K+ transport system membrane component KefB
MKSLSPEDIASYLTQLTVLLAFSYLGGQLMKRLKQPALVGNILAGILLGPSVLGHWFPELQLWIFKPDQNQANMLSAIAWVGLLLFLMEAGLDVKLDVLKRNGYLSLLVSAGGIILPLLSGFFLGQLLPERLLVHPQDRLPLSLFLGVSMAISALPPIAMILREKKMIRSKMGQIALGAAMLDDVFAWVLVAVATGLYLTGSFSALAAAKSVGAALLFLGFSFLLGRPLLRRFMQWHNVFAPGASAQLSVLIIFGITGSLITIWLGLESAFGIFVAGILLASLPMLQRNAVHALSLIISSFLAPLYFGLAGLRLNLWDVANWSTFSVLLLVIGIACIGKMVGVYFGAWLGGMPFWERMAMGFGMNARGGTEIIIATLCLSIGLLTREMYSVIVVMAVVTVILSGPTMSWALSHIRMKKEETDPASPEYLMDEALADPHQALDLAELEELRLAERLRLYCQALIGSPSEKMGAVDSIQESFSSVAQAVENFLQKLASQSLCPNTSLQLIRLQNQLGLLRYLEDTLRLLYLNSRKISGTGQFGENLLDYGRKLDLLVSDMKDAMKHQEPTAAAKLLSSTDRECDFLANVRRDFAQRDSGPDSPERSAFFQVAHGFEQTLWLLHRMAILAEPVISLKQCKPVEKTS